MRRLASGNAAVADGEIDAASLPRRSLARALLATVIVALCLAAFVAIGILLFGDFGETEGKVLLTTLGIAGYSLLGLAATTALGRQPRFLGPSGLVATAVGFALFVAVVWISPEGENLGRLMGVSLVLSIANAHAALLFFMTRETAGRRVLSIRRATLFANAVVSAMLVGLIMSDSDPPQLFARVLGAVAVLVVLGSLLLPILLKLGGQPSLPASTVDAGDLLEVRYKGRAAKVRISDNVGPMGGFTVDAWETVDGGRVRYFAITGATPQPDRHSAFGLAVQLIVAEVDDAEGTRSPAPESAPGLKLAPDIW
jgi:hypothetical protein